MNWIVIRKIIIWDTNSKVWSCRGRKLPEKIDSSIQYTDEDDLRISHIGVVGEFI